MIERTPEFLAAQDRVKVGHFTRQGFDIGGVVHVGANDGYEIPFYLQLGAPRVIAFEPLESAFVELTRAIRDPRVQLRAYALSDHFETKFLSISDGDGKGSTFLHEINTPYNFAQRQRCRLRRFDSLALDLTDMDTLVVDVQGMELQVLKGFGEKLAQFNFLNIECSRLPLYVGEASAQQVIDYLDRIGFDQDSPICDHDDIMFIRKGLK